MFEEIVTAFDTAASTRECTISEYVWVLWKIVIDPSST